MSQAITIAAFDFDGTLTVKDSFIGFCKMAVGPVRFYTTLLRYAIPLIARKLRGKDGGDIKERIFADLFGGWDEGRFNLLCERYGSAATFLYNDSTVASLKRHAHEGDKVIVVSASIKNWIEPSTRHLPVEEVIATEVEIVDGRLTGRFSTPNCIGSEKVSRLKARPWWSDAAVIHAYGDNGGDNAMLDIANYPHRIKR